MNHANMKMKSDVHGPVLKKFIILQPIMGRKWLKESSLPVWWWRETISEPSGKKVSVERSVSIVILSLMQCSSQVAPDTQWEIRGG